jgi:hypothetical protein
MNVYISSTRALEEILFYLVLLARITAGQYPYVWQQVIIQGFVQINKE